MYLGRVSFEKEPRNLSAQVFKAVKLSFVMLLYFYTKHIPKKKIFQIDTWHISK